MRLPVQNTGTGSDKNWIITTISLKQKDLNNLLTVS